MVRVTVVNWQCGILARFTKYISDALSDDTPGARIFLASFSALDGAPPVASTCWPVGNETALARSAICPLAGPRF